jgi:hypothetical protein
MLIKNQKKAKEDAADIIEFSQVEDDPTQGFGLHNKFQLDLEDKPRK